MSLYQTIADDMKAAMKSGDSTRLEVIRFMYAGLQGVLKEKQTKDPSAALSDEETISILQKEAKRRREAIELFKQGNRNDLVTKEEADMKIIDAYLPAQMSREEIVKIVADLHAGGNSEFSTLMREVTKITKGRADGKLVAEIVKEKLG